jgi:putative transposase
VTVTPAERARLVKFGKKVGGAIREWITIVTPRTFARWGSGETAKSGTTPRRRPGRPRTHEKVREKRSAWADALALSSCLSETA